MGLPSGVGITGSSMVMALQTYDISSLNAMLGTFVFRTGTVWFAVALGCLVFILYRRRLQALLSLGQVTDHFDEIAEPYGPEAGHACKPESAPRNIQQFAPTD